MNQCRQEIRTLSQNTLDDFVELGVFDIELLRASASSIAVRAGTSRHTNKGEESAV